MNAQSSDERGSIDWLGLLRAHGRFALIVAVSVAVLVGVAGWMYVRWGQQTQMVASLEFRPTFSGLTEMEYPNGLPFSPNDVTAVSIVDSVYDTNNIGASCDRDSFRSGFYVEQRSDLSVYLDLEYQSRLTEPRMTSVERKLLQEEHAAKRKALPIQYRLVFVAPPSCAGLSTTVISKVMNDTLETWAAESESKRGVLNHQIEVLTPASLDVKIDGPGGLLLRADLLRSALTRVAQNVQDVSELPGAMLVRLGPGRVTFVEIQARIKDLVGSRLDPLVMTSGRLMARDSALWVAETVATAERRKKGADQKVQNYLTALRAYTSTNPVGALTNDTSPRIGAGPNGTQGQAPMFDESFVNRIVELSNANVAFRQSLTNDLVSAQLEAVLEDQRADYYKRLQGSIGAGASGDASDLEARLNSIVDEGKELTKQFGQLYDEFSRVALRASAALYEARKPVAIETTQPYARRSVMNLAASFVGALVLTLAFFALRGRLRLGIR